MSLQVDMQLADLVSRLLVREPESRMTAAQALGHPFLAPETPLHWMLRPHGEPPQCREANHPLQMNDGYVLTRSVSLLARS